MPLPQDDMESSHTARRPCCPAPPGLQLVLSTKLCSKIEARSSPISKWSPEAMSALTTQHSQALIAKSGTAGEVIKEKIAKLGQAGFLQAKTDT